MGLPAKWQHSISILEKALPTTCKFEPSEFVAGGKPAEAWGRRRRLHQQSCVGSKSQQQTHGCKLIEHEYAGVQTLDEGSLLLATDWRHTYAKHHGDC